MVASSRRRVLRRLFSPFRQVRRSQILVMAGLAALALFLLWQATGVGQYRQNLALNVGADVIGAMITIFVITPLLNRAQDGRVREHARLDYEWFTDQVYGATSCVKLLDTFSNLLDQPVTDRFLRAVLLAIGRQADIQVLLLDPDSLAATLRAQELGESEGHLSVRREILRNLRVLTTFERRLTDEQRRHFEVRLYAASAGVTLYRWDDKSMVSFLSVGRLSGQGGQLEVTAGSALGLFVEQRFEELWQQSKPMAQFMRIPVTLVGADGWRRDYTSQFVVLDDGLYVIDQDVVSQMARRRTGDLTAYCRGEVGIRYEPVVVDEDVELFVRLRGHYADKYDLDGSTFVWLRPLTVGSLDHAAQALPPSPRLPRE
jgi:hypothetical protein